MAKERVLIVDDEPKVVHLVREVLSATGYEVLAAYSGETAIETVALEQPDLLQRCLCLQLPKLPGMFTRLLRMDL